MCDKSGRSIPFVTVKMPFFVKIFGSKSGQNLQSHLNRLNPFTVSHVANLFLQCVASESTGCEHFHSKGIGPLLFLLILMQVNGTADKRDSRLSHFPALTVKFINFEPAEAIATTKTLKVNGAFSKKLQQLYD